MLLASRTIPPEVHGHGRFVLRSAEFVPAYLRAYEDGRLRAKVEEALEALRACRLCPRDCGIDRLENRFAVCKVGRHARVSAAFHHFGEEDVLRGWNGSGTIFFSWCNLRCVFCLSPDTGILTDRGVLPVEQIFESAKGREVVIGDGIVRYVEGLRVYTHEGRLAPVAKAFRHRHQGELITIKPYGLPAISVTPNHSVFAALGEAAEPRKMAAGELTDRHVLFVPRLEAAAREQPIVPAALVVAPDSVVRAFLEAYLEGDGRQHPAHVAATTVSRELAMGLRRVRHQADERGFRVPIRNITRIPYDGPVYNLEVADDAHSYVANGVAVGNCQNFETSQIGEGEEVTPRELAGVMLRLQAEGAHNINLVTPEHVVPQILEALLIAVEGGLRLPLVYNTSAYDSEHSIGLLEDVVDVYMPDFKLWDRERSRRYLLAPDYPEAARRAIQRMHEQVGVLRVDEDGLARRGVLVRHLVMPGMLDDTREIVRWLAALSPDTYVNIMDQYAPAWRAKTEARFHEINRRVTRREMDEALALARAAGLWRFDTRWRRMPTASWAGA